MADKHINIKLGTLFDNRGIAEANRALASLASDVRDHSDKMRQAVLKEAAAYDSVATQADKMAKAVGGSYLDLEEEAHRLESSVREAFEAQRNAAIEAKYGIESFEKVLRRANEAVLERNRIESQSAEIENLLKQKRQELESIEDKNSAAYLKTSHAVKVLEEAQKQMGVSAVEASESGSKAATLMAKAMSAARGNVSAMVSLVGDLSSKLKVLGGVSAGAVGAFVAALFSAFKLLSAVKDLVAVAFNMNQASDEVKEAAKKFNDLNNAAETFNAAMKESREISERQVKAFEDEANALAKVIKAQNELNRQMELGAAKTDDERQKINSNWDSANAEAEEEAAQNIRDSRAKALRDEETRINTEIKNARRLQKEYQALFGTAQGGEAADRVLEQESVIDDAKKRLDENRRQQRLLEEENKAAEAMIEARKKKEENAAKLIEEKKAEAKRESAEKQAKIDADNAKKAAEAEAAAAQAAAKERERLDRELHQKRMSDLRAEIEAQKNTAEPLRAAASAAQSEFDRAFAMYRDPTRAAAEIAEERDYAEDLKQLHKDASRYGGKWRIDELSALMAAGDGAGVQSRLADWRKSRSFTPEVEAMVRASAAERTKTTAEEELRKIEHNTANLGQKLDELLAMKN